MTNEDFNALVELIKALALEAVIDAHPAHDRRAKTDGGRGAIEAAWIHLVGRYEANE